MVLNGTYIPQKFSFVTFAKIGFTLDIGEYYNFLSMGDFHMEVLEDAMHVFGETYNLVNLNTSQPDIKILLILAVLTRYLPIDRVASSHRNRSL